MAGLCLAMPVHRPSHRRGKKRRKRVLQEMLRVCLWALPPSLNKQNIFIPPCFLWKQTGSPHSWFLSTRITKFFPPSRKWSRQQHQLDGRKKMQRSRSWIASFPLCSCASPLLHHSFQPRPEGLKLCFQPRSEVFKPCLQRELGWIYCRHLLWTLVKQSEST